MATPPVFEGAVQDRSIWVCPDAAAPRPVGATGGVAITGYQIEVSSNAGTSWTDLEANTGSTATSYAHTGLAPGTTRHYRVSAINSVGTSPASNVASATTGAATAPLAPTGLGAAASGQTQIDLSWTAPSNTGGVAITGYQIEVSSNAGTSWTDLEANTGSTATSYAHTGLAPGTTRHYRVSAINSVGTSPASNVASATTGAATAPLAPTGLGAAASGQTQIDLSWTAPSNTGGVAITGYQIEVSSNAGTSWTDLEANTGSTATSYAHTGLAPGTTRHYRVSAINSVGTSPASNVASATTGAVTVRLSASSNLVDEGESVRITAAFSEALTNAVTIYLIDTPGTPPTEPGDYTPLTGITIDGGKVTGFEDLRIHGDDIAEGNETFTVAIDASRLDPGIVLGDPSSVEITIVDHDDPPPVEVSLLVDPARVEEGQPVTVTAVLTAALEVDVIVPLKYDSPGTTADNEDYEKLDSVMVLRGEKEGSGQIQTKQDADMEDETLIVELGILPKDLLVVGKELTKTITIVDVFPVSVRLEAAPNPVKEGDAVTVTARLSKVLSRDVDVTIPLILPDGGTAGVEDYTAPSPVQIEVKANELSGTYKISIMDDDVAEDAEDFTVKFGDLPPGLVAEADSLIIVTIAENDPAGIQVPPSISVREGGTNSFEVSLASEPRGAVRVTLDWPSNTDLEIMPRVLSFTSDNWNKPQQVTLRAREDDDLEDDPIIEVNLIATGAGYTDVKDRILVRITDNDAAGIHAPPVVMVKEGSSKEFELSLTQQPSGQVTVTVPGSVGDLTANPTRLSFTQINWGDPQPITLAAAEDHDFLDDTEHLILIATGADYTGVTDQILVKITDNDEAQIIADEDVTLEEGGTFSFEVSLSAQPSSSVTVTLTGHAGTDLMLDQNLLIFTPATWMDPQIVTLTASDDADDVDDTVTLTLTASGGGYDAEHITEVIITDYDEREAPLALSLYDERGSEATGSLQLYIELNRPSEEEVTVEYETSDVEAEAGLDYTASHGIVIFDPGATHGVILITITDDDLLEENERFEVTLSNARNAIITRETGTGTILDNDGSAKIRVEDALVMEEDGAVQFRVTLSAPQSQMVSAAYRTQDGTAKAGEDYEAASGVVTLAPGITEATIAVPLLKDGLDWQEETFTIHLESSEHAEIDKAVGVATIHESTTVSEGVMEAYAARFVRTSSSQIVEALDERLRSGIDGASCGAAERAEMAQLWHSNGDPSLGELLAGCRVSQSTLGSGGSFRMWGQGAFRQFHGRGEGALTLDGEVTTGMLGMDYGWGKIGGSNWVAGMLLARSQGDGSFEVVEQSGEITVGLTGIYPYVSYTRPGWDLWLSVGAGRGQAEVLELKGDLVSRFGAMGVRRALISKGAIGLSYHGDILMTDAEIDDHDITAEVYRIRAGLEITTQITDGIRPYVEANVRQDGGSAETGTGLELSAGVRLAYPAWRLRAEMHTQGLVMHTVDGFTEWGFSGSFQVGTRSEGWMMRLRPSWGRGQGMSLYRQQTILDAVPLGENANRTELELGYGIPWEDGTARSVIGMTRLPRGMMIRLGGELRPWERLTFSVFGLAYGSTATLGDIGVNVQGSLRY